MDFTIPQPKTELFKGSVSYSGAKLWNTIPNNIKESDSIKSVIFNYTKWLHLNQ